jgi:hypothetical protein
MAVDSLGDHRVFFYLTKYKNIFSQRNIDMK